MTERHQKAPPNGGALSSGGYRLGLAAGQQERAPLPRPRDLLHAGGKALPEQGAVHLGARGGTLQQHGAAGAGLLASGFLEGI